MIFFTLALCSRHYIHFSTGIFVSFCSLIHWYFPHISSGWICLHVFIFNLLDRDWTTWNVNKTNSPLFSYLSQSYSLSLSHYSAPNTISLSSANLLFLIFCLFTMKECFLPTLLGIRTILSGSFLFLKRTREKEFLQITSWTLVSETHLLSPPVFAITIYTYIWDTSQADCKQKHNQKNKLRKSYAIEWENNSNVLANTRDGHSVDISTGMTHTQYIRVYGIFNGASAGEEA